ncbi:signal peptidase 22 kDa subunit [Coniophora puteana RWD-64-598 SS2]|uniref:Signal peptidase subunit 3 n=1 Tax=Coniophora puteana (strain RWD-64-598) TaxID=741705 RepID=A0A5M3MWH4_CONPW|nr:signal peptidase 22 kDa subunit [Coniophora puteana RWD-64-598 SS2]EIW83499.1 signal peptidase 22 kDa subunit [Coniophora puteana RWD-64-598 SS2]
MHSIYARINGLTALLSTCVMVLLGTIALSSLIYTADPKGELSINSIRVHPGKERRYPRRTREFAFVNFNVTADLTPLFNWNTKQLFLYLEAEYENVKGVKNDVVIWDRIVRRKEDAVINVQGKNKYKFKDLAKSFKDVPPAHYSLKYNVMPYVGVLTYGEAARTTEAIEFPEAQDTM